MHALNWLKIAFVPECSVVGIQIVATTKKLFLPLALELGSPCTVYCVCSHSNHTVQSGSLMGTNYHTR